MRVARILGAVGRALITAGVVILLFVAYQLWGTGIREAQAQNRLEDEFEAVLVEVEPERGATTTTTTPPPPPSEGNALARLAIPKIGVDKIVVEGVSLSDLKKGPGHYPESPMPGQEGNAAIAGHRTTYGAPFHRLDELNPGDTIEVTTVQGSFTYEVADTEGDGNGWFVVSPTQVEVLDDHGDDRLTLTACHPKYSARQRIIVVAMLQEPTVAAPPPEEPERKVVTRTRTIDAGLSGERATAWPAIWFGLAAAAVWLGAWLLGRWWRRWPSYALGLVPFVVLLFFTFENFARLLPANY